MWAPKFSTWKKQGDLLRTSGITLPLGFQGSPTLTSNTYTTWKCPEISHSEENVCCVWIILSFSFRCGGQYSWWGCGRISTTTPSTVPISLLMAFVDLVLSSSYTSSSAGPAGYFSQIKKKQDPVSYHDLHVYQNHSPALKHFPWNLSHWKINIYHKLSRVCKTIGQCSSRKNYTR